MKILYDHQAFSETYGGVSRYFSDLFRYLPENVEKEIAVKYSNNTYLSDFMNIKSFLENLNFRGKVRLISKLNEQNSIKLIKKGDYDIYHQTHYNPYGFKLLQGKKNRVMTVYDMNFFINPELYKNSNFANTFREYQKESILNADRIIAISNFSKIKLQEYFEVPDEKISVIHLGIEANTSYGNLPEFLVEKKYILFVGQRKYQKNFSNFIKAFAEFQKKNNDVYLVCTGLPFDNEEKEQIKKLSIQDYVIQIKASEIMLQTLYKNAIFFVYPSLYEGFGLPLLEAMRADCPVLCSDASCFPEIVQNAAMFFDPCDIDSMVNSMNELYYNKDVRESLISNGRERLLNFSLKKCADEHVKVYESMININGV